MPLDVGRRGSLAIPTRESDHQCQPLHLPVGNDTQATSGNIRFVARKRVGGQVVLAEAIRELKVAA